MPCAFPAGRETRSGGHLGHPPTAHGCGPALRPSPLSHDVAWVHQGKAEALCIHARLCMYMEMTCIFLMYILVRVYNVRITCMTHHTYIYIYMYTYR